MVNTDGEEVGEEETNENSSLQAHFSIVKCFPRVRLADGPLFLRLVKVKTRVNSSPR